jgi:hypothetical protein
MHKRTMFPSFKIIHVEDISLAKNSTSINKWQYLVILCGYQYVYVNVLLKVVCVFVWGI